MCADDREGRMSDEPPHVFIKRLQLFPERKIRRTANERREFFGRLDLRSKSIKRHANSPTENLISYLSRVSPGKHEAASVRKTGAGSELKTEVSKKDIAERCLSPFFNTRPGQCTERNALRSESGHLSVVPLSLPGIQDWRSP